MNSECVNRNIYKFYVEKSDGIVGRNSSPGRRMISDHATADTLVRPPGANCAILNGSSVERTRILALFARSILVTPTIASRNSPGEIQKLSNIDCSNTTENETK